VTPAAAATAEAAEWLARFAKAVAWFPNGHGFAVLLARRAAPLLRESDKDSTAGHLAEFGRLFLEARPSLPAEAASALRRAAQLLNASNEGMLLEENHTWPLQELAALHGAAGRASYQAGDVVVAIDSFELALDLNRQAVAVRGDQENYKRLVVSQVDLAMVLLGTATLRGGNQGAWRASLGHFREARHAARLGHLEPNDEVMISLEATYFRALRLAHRRGVLNSCPGPLDALLYGISCPMESAEH